MYYSDEVIEQVRSANEIVSVISAYVKLKRQGANYFGLCPFHSERSPSFSVSPSKQIFYCFGCGVGGSVIAFVMQYENYTFPEAVRFLAQRAGISLPEEESSQERMEERNLKSRILEVNKEAAVFYYALLKSPAGSDAMNYLTGRGLDEQTIRQFGLGYAGRYSNQLVMHLRKKGYPDDLILASGLGVGDEKHGLQDKFWNRVMFPIMDVQGKVIAFGGRVMGDAKPKYLNSPETPIFNKSRTLYGLNYARKARTRTLIICEGYMDVIAMHKAGFANAVATLGTSLTSQHGMMIKRYADEVVLSYDSDEAGTKAALRAINILQEADLPVRVLDLSPYKDPDEFIKALGTEAFQERIDKAKGSFFFELENMQKGFDLKDPQSKTAFFRAVSERIALFEEELERDNYIEAAAGMYHVSTQSLKKMVGNVLMKGVKTPSSVMAAGRDKDRSEKTTSLEESERLLLTWLCEYPSFYASLKEYVTPGDFEEGFYREAASMLYQQLEEGDPKPVRIIDRFEDPAQQSAAAALFNTPHANIDERELKKSMRETISRIMENSLKKTVAESARDVGALQRMIEMKKKLGRVSEMDIEL